jgi:DNA-binding response OmpR family regulator
VADSYPEVRNLFASYLTRFGFRVERASNGPEAERSIRRSVPRVILMEPHLPCGDPETWAIPIILLTAAFDESAGPAAAFRPAAVLHKPFHLAQLIAEVRRVLARERS